MAKKTIQDLRINDSVFLCYGNSCEELKIETLSTSLLITSGRKNITVKNI